MDETAVEIKDLVKKFGSFTAVDHIDFAVKKGEVFGFLGANGAGKTTTIRIICGLLQPTEGDVMVNGLSVRRKKEQIKKNIGYMSQKFSLYQDLTPEMNIDFFGAVYGVDKRKLKEDKSRLSAMLSGVDVKRTKTGELPMGFKQRLGLFCALLHDPPVVFLDEPTSGVDPLGRRAFWEEIYRLSSEGKTILVTTHFMDEAEYCDRIAIMNRGRVIALDSPQAVKKRYESESLNEAFIKAVEGDRHQTDGEG